jgi:hypothetical protein
MNRDRTSLKLCAASDKSAMLPETSPPIIWAIVIIEFSRIVIRILLPVAGWCLCLLSVII